MNIFDVKDKYILITGASSGLGHHIAELFAKKVPISLFVPDG